MLSKATEAPGTKTPPLSVAHQIERNRLASRRNYQKRKAANLCVYSSGCFAKPQTGHSYCPQHLGRISHSRKEVERKRKKLGLCTYCGLRPQFWGVRCVVCRLQVFDDPLPFGARKALRIYRQAEKQFQIDQLQSRARFAVRKLLLIEDIRKLEEKALRLLVGLDDGQWRSYAEVGQRMNVTKQRVHRLVAPYSTTIFRLLNEDEPMPEPIADLRFSDVAALLAVSRKRRP